MLNNTILKILIASSIYLLCIGYIAANQEPIKVESIDAESVSTDELGNLKLSGNVYIKTNYLEFWSQKATYNSENQSFILEGEVKALSKNLSIDANQLIANLSNQTFFLSKTSYTLLERTFGEADEFSVLASGNVELLNTSFNNNCEPIVDSIDDAVMCFLTTELTHLIVDDYIVYKIAALEKFIITFALAIKCSCRVTTGYKLGAQGFKNTYTIESNASKYFSEESVEISESLFRVLTLGQGLRLKTACEKLNIEFSEALKKEVIKLCENRFISFIPTTKVVN